MVWTYSGYLLVSPETWANQQTTTKGVEVWGVITVATVRELQWGNAWRTQWVFHIPHHPQAACLTERMKGLLKQKINHPTTPDHTQK